jgi:hypothetical protein
MSTRRQVGWGVTMIVMIVATSAPVHSQERLQPLKKQSTSRGTWEFGGTLGFSSTQPVTNGTTGESVSVLTVEPLVGYFIFDGWEIGAHPAGLVYRSAGGQTSTEIRTLASVSYNLKTATIVTPYVSGLGGFTAEIVSTSGARTTRQGFSWGGQAGIKVGLVEHGTLVIAAQYLQISLSPAGATTRSGINEFSIQAGWTVWL